MPTGTVFRPRQAAAEVETTLPQRVPERSSSSVSSERADTTAPARRRDSADDPADLAIWFAFYLAGLLLSLLALGGLWIWNFAR